MLLVHHARKGAANLRAGQALRGSSEFHAWGDSNLYLRRAADRLSLTIEHRAAPSPPSLALELHADGDALALRLAQSVTEPPPAPASVDERITAALLDAAGALTVNELRHQCRVRNTTLYERLAALTRAGRIQRSCDGYRIAPAASDHTSPPPPPAALLPFPLPARLYRCSEAEPGTPSKRVTVATSMSVITLTIVRQAARSGRAAASRSQVWR